MWTDLICCTVQVLVFPVFLLTSFKSSLSSLMHINGYEVHRKPAGF